jgi:methyl-accepting chemotaxis protein
MPTSLSAAFDRLMAFTNKTSVRTRLIVVNVIVAAITLITAVFAISGSSNAKSSYNQSLVPSRQQTLAHNGYEGWLQQDDQSNMYVALAALHDPSQKSLIAATWAQVVQGEQQAQAAFKSIGKLPISNPEIRKQISRTERDYDAYTVFTNEVRAAGVAGNAIKAVHIMTVTNAATSNQTQEDYSKLDSLFYHEQTEIGRSLLGGLSSLVSRTLIISVIALLVSTISLLVVMFSITKPLAQLLRAAKRVALGYVDVELPAESNDEVGVLAETFREITDNLRSISVHAEAIASGVLTEEIVPRSDGDVLSRAFIKLQSSLQAAISDIAGSADQLSRASESMATASDDTGRAVGEIALAISEVAQGAEEQVRAVDGARQLADELAEIAMQTMDTAAQATGVAAHARELAHDGAIAASDASEAMSSVRDTSHEAVTVMHSLGERSNKIGGIVETITGIASQTNLLSLNAAIEAARAGEHGRGFAVVAEEVRKLADESKQAAETIGELISEMQNETAHAVEIVQESAERTDSGSETVERAREAFVAIGDSVQEVSSQVDGIHSAIDVLSSRMGAMRDTMLTVASVAEEASASTEEVSASAEESSASTEEVAANAQELSITADTLKQVVGQFSV